MYRSGLLCTPDVMELQVIRWAELVGAWVYNMHTSRIFRVIGMFFTSDGWLGLGVVVFICAIVVGFSAGVGKSIIWLFGMEYRAVAKFKEDHARDRSEIHEVA